jgi:hypothetical protein
MAEIVLLTEPIDEATLDRLVRETFVDMVKYVVDVERRQVAIGGDMHADAELVLIENGSRQGDLWGANYYPKRPPAECIEFTSLINIRPARGNPGMVVQDPEIQRVIREITHALVGRGNEPR